MRSWNRLLVSLISLTLAMVQVTVYSQQQAGIDRQARLSRLEEQARQQEQWNVGSLGALERLQGKISSLELELQSERARVDELKTSISVLKSKSTSSGSRSPIPVPRKTMPREEWRSSDGHAILTQQTDKGLRLWSRSGWEQGEAADVLKSDGFGVYRGPMQRFPIDITTGGMQINQATWTRITQESAELMLDVDLASRTRPPGTSTITIRLRRPLYQVLEE